MRAARPFARSLQATVLSASVLLGGCGSILGVYDIDPPADASRDAGSGGESGGGSDGPPIDATGDTTTLSDDGAAPDVDVSDDGTLPDEGTIPDDGSSPEASDGGPPDGEVTDGGDGGPHACAKGGCNAAGGACTAADQACFCTADGQCPSGKCVSATGKNAMSCGAGCTGSGSADGFGCQLASPGIPAPTFVSPPTCPASSGYHGTTLACDSTTGNCICNADTECPNGKCIPSTHNGSCSGAGPCTGTGTADYRGCTALAAIGACAAIVGCATNTTCNVVTCYCSTDTVCESGRCISSSHNSGACASSGNCTGAGTDDGHGCLPAPASVPCGSATYACSTALSPAPVVNAAHTECLCVADADCASGKCSNAGSQCTGTCTGSTASGAYDANDCQLLTSK